MNYRSTRSDLSVALDAALQRGLAADGGLFVPTSLPAFSPEDFAGDLSFADIAVRYLSPFFAGSSLQPALPDIVAETFSFPLPLRDLSETFAAPLSVLELFHGPTAAFKDVGARFLAACLARLDTDGADDRPLTILVATSGDTGGAVASAFHGRSGFEVVVLFPEGRVSPRQQHQLTCWGGNVTACAVQGAFDDCQALVKAAFADPALASRHRFSSANSINIGRLLPQSVYYAASALAYFRRTGESLNWFIPTGNLGNGLACVLARACGLPIGDIVFVANENKTLPDYFEKEDYIPRPSVATLASAMDVGAPSNLERLRDLFGEAPALKAAELSAVSVSDAEIRARIAADAARLPFVWCPHSATAMVAWARLTAAARQRHWAVVATAHPAKFETIVEPIVGHAVAIPPALAALLERPTSYATIAPDLAELQQVLP